MNPGELCILVGAIYLAPHMGKPIGPATGLIVLLFGVGNGLLEALT